MKNAFFALLLALGASSAPALAQTRMAAPSPIAVPANAGWVNTNIAVTRGGRLEINVRDGRWSVTERSLAAATRANPIVTPDGYQGTANANPALPLPSANYGALIGRIGEGAPFLVGAAYAGEANANGTLFLSVNDATNELRDNQGGLFVSVTFSPPPPAITPNQNTNTQTSPAEPNTQAAPGDTNTIVQAEPEAPTAPAAATPTPEEPNIALSSLSLSWPLIAGLLAAFGGLLLLFRLMRPSTGGQASDQRGEVHVPQITARVTSDGLADQTLTVKMGRRP